MGALDRFLGQPKEIDFREGKITIKPIQVKDLGKITKENPTPEEGLQIAKDMIKLSVDDVTDEDIDKLSLEFYTKLLTEINKLNGFGDEQSDSVRKLLEKRQKRS